ncbi:MAG: UvrD-helicase domain-containing protein [Gammaproteobacteria bacterium]|nr:UvrD-helicase domain-containing protein [Gammaproteobacteria bacterium]
MQDLNSPQQQAITCIDSPCLVLAGAGSGKTRVITYKVAHLINAGYAPSTIRAVTFTNKSAREMKQRVTALLGKKTAKGLGISTFHTMGLRILQSEYTLLGYRKGFSIMDARDVESCLGELMLRSEQDDPAFVKQTMYQISRWKNEFIEAATAQASAATPLEQMQAQIYQAYQDHLLACNAVDFDDLIMLPVQLFRGNDNILLKWRGKIHYLLVDEYQDTNASQYELIKLICGLRQKLTVVGDDDQSIYAWRGARPENINRLQDDFRGLQVIKLEQNYRSSGRILNTANVLIANNAHLFDKKLWSAAGPGEYIRVFPCKNTEDEANRVAIDIISKRLQNNESYSRFAILYRSNFQSRNYEKALRENSIPYQITGGTAFFERREVKDIMAYLRLLSNIDDDQALIRIINTPRREIGSSTIQQLASYAGNRRCSMGQALQELGLKESIGNRAWQRLQSFIELISELRREVERLDAMAVARLLVARLDYGEWLTETCSSQKQAGDAMENIEELISWIGNLQKTRDDNSLSALISHLSLMSILENDEDKTEQDAVQLMTLHAAKGLEYPHVYLVCFEEDSLPHHQSQDADGLEEERRLAYVGITRAEQTLTICHARTRQKFGELQHCEPSRFLFELPEEDLDGADHLASKLSESEKKQRGLNTFADLKAMLNAE